MSLICVCMRVFYVYMCMFICGNLLIELAYFSYVFSKESLKP